MLRILLGLAALSVSAGCRSDYHDPHDRVIHYDRKLESDLLRDVGPPSQARLVRDTESTNPCRNGMFGAEADRELRYDVPSRGFEKRAREILRVAPSQTLVVCVATTGKIMRVVIEEIH